MDPDECLARIMRALAEDDAGEAHCAIEDLTRWLRSGGYEPDWARYDRWPAITGFEVHYADHPWPVLAHAAALADLIADRHDDKVLTAAGYYVAPDGSWRDKDGHVLSRSDRHAIVYG